METEKLIWHDRTDWVVKSDGRCYWHKNIDSDQWDPGVPPGMTEHDVDLLSS